MGDAPRLGRVAARSHTPPPRWSGRSRRRRTGVVSLPPAARAHHTRPIARARFEEGRELASRTGNRERLAAFLNDLGELERLQGHHAAARDLYRETLAATREIGRPDFEAVVLANLGAVSVQLGELAEAERWAREGLRTARAIGFLPMVLGSLTVLAQLRERAGDQEGALAWLGLVLGHPAADADVCAYAVPVLERLGAELGADDIEAGLARGRTMDFEATVTGLLGESGARS